MKVKDFDEIKKLSNDEKLQITEWNLNFNQRKELPPEIGELKNLQTLYLVGNQLKELPPEIGELKNLQRLYLGNNQLKELPPAGQFNSNQEIQEYLKNHSLKYILKDW